jgi:glycosyltransferase involved in cell wall biosynthesis
MRLTHITPSLEVRHGGPSKSVRALAGALARDGADVELLATDPGPAREDREEGLAVRRFPRGWPERFCPSPRLRDYLRTDRTEIVHHHSVWLRTLHYAHTCAARNRVPFVVSPRGMLNDWAWHHHPRRKQLAARLIHPGALAAVDGWHATSEQEARDIRARGFDQPICLAPNGVDLPAPQACAAARDHWLAACPEIGQRPTALFYARFHRKKRVVELIDAWLEQAPPDWLLLLVGIPEDYAVAALQAYVQRSLGAARVRVFDGANRPEPYAVASLFLLPSHSENFGLAIAEAMANGVPALVTDGSPWATLNDRDLGWCVPWPDYPSALRAALAEGPDRLRARGQRARAWVQAEYSWAKAAATLLAFYPTLRA